MIFFKRKRKSKNIKEAIDFIKLQKSLNKKNIAKLKELNISTKELDEWNTLYNKIIKILDSINES